MRSVKNVKKLNKDVDIDQLKDFIKTLRGEIISLKHAAIDNEVPLKDAAAVYKAVTLYGDDIIDEICACDIRNIEPKKEHFFVRYVLRHLEWDLPKYCDELKNRNLSDDIFTWHHRDLISGNDIYRILKKYFLLERYYRYKYFSDLVKSEENLKKDIAKSDLIMPFMQSGRHHNQYMPGEIYFIWDQKISDLLNDEVPHEFLVSVIMDGCGFIDQLLYDRFDEYPVPDDRIKPIHAERILNAGITNQEDYKIKNIIIPDDISIDNSEAIDRFQTSVTKITRNSFLTMPPVANFLNYVKTKMSNGRLDKVSVYDMEVDQFSKKVIEAFSILMNDYNYYEPITTFPSYDLTPMEFMVSNLGYKIQ